MADQVTNYQCPACTGPLHYAAASGKLECEYCGSAYDVAEIEKLVGQELRDVEQLRAVLIIARKERQQIVERVHAQPCKQPRPHGAHPAQRTHRRVKIERLFLLLCHNTHSFLFFYQYESV